MDVQSGKEIFSEEHEDHVQNMDWSPDGRWIATSSFDATVGIWDARTGDLRFSLFHDGPVGDADWSSDGGRLVTGTSDGRATVWEITGAGGKRLFSLSAQDTSSGVQGVAFSPDGYQVLTGMQRSPRPRYGTLATPETRSGRTYLATPHGSSAWRSRPPAAS